MARILHLEDNEHVREKLKTLLQKEGHQVVGFDCHKKALEAHLKESFDLYVCGQLGKYSDGLAFAADMQHQNKKVLVISDKQKFSKIPYLSVYFVSRKGEYLLGVVRKILTGG
jgi:DNA-binding NtrC family response regulator